MPLPDVVYVCGLLLEDVVPDVVVVADCYYKGHYLFSHKTHSPFILCMINIFNIFHSSLDGIGLCSRIVPDPFPGCMVTLRALHLFDPASGLD